jgi:hypothetical protein
MLCMSCSSVPPRARARGRTATLMWIGIECSGQFRLALTNPSAFVKSHGGRQRHCNTTTPSSTRPTLAFTTLASPSADAPPPAPPALHHLAALAVFQPAAQGPCPAPLVLSLPVARRQLLPREPRFSASPSRRTHAVAVTLAPPVHSPVAAVVARRRTPRSPPNEHPPSLRRTSAAALAP